MGACGGKAVEKSLRLVVTKSNDGCRFAWLSPAASQVYTENLRRAMVINEVRLSRKMSIRDPKRARYSRLYNQELETNTYVRAPLMKQTTVFGAFEYFKWSVPNRGVHSPMKPPNKGHPRHRGDVNVLAPAGLLGFGRVVYQHIL